MTGAIETALWSVTGRSVCGASHRRRNMGNQDALGWSPAGAHGIVAAVADGHGSTLSYRSAEGAAIAVEAALAVLGDFAARCPEYDPVVDACAASIPRDLVSGWRAAVSAHAAEYPLDGRFSEATFAVYGSTVVSVLATETYLLSVQLGDGDILMVPENGVVSRPWPRDPRLLGVETTSLVSQEAAADVRVSVGPASPALIILATDGYANSFRDDAGFLSIGSDLLHVVRESGLAGLELNLESWLNETSELGSGDDITIVVVSRAAREPADGR